VLSKQKAGVRMTIPQTAQMMKEATVKSRIKTIITTLYNSILLQENFLAEMKRCSEGYKDVRQMEQIALDHFVNEKTHFLIKKFRFQNGYNKNFYLFQVRS
jgi:hypothetical protein